MPIRKYTNSRISVKRFTAPGIGAGGGTPVAPVVTNTAIQIFTESSAWVAPPGVTSVEYLVVAGGGGGCGAGSSGATGAGGGAGGYRSGTGLTVTANQTYTIVVGAGGAGPGYFPLAFGGNGSNSGIYSTGVVPFSSLWKVLHG